jgi:hypothetical protein
MENDSVARPEPLSPDEAQAKAESKAFFPDFRHRALRHHTEGIFLCERILGLAISNSEGAAVPVGYIGEQHVREDLG